jgi:CPA2 family monovalent cation:H+ antiporter-2
MELTTILLEVAIIFLVASIFGLILSRLKQPPIFAYILAGICLGPGVFGIIHNHDLIEVLSEIGVIALLFTLGLEFSLDKFKEIRNHVLFAGFLQILLTISFVGVIAFFLGGNLNQCILIGSIVALSSTVVVLKTLTDAAQIDSIHGRIILGILIIQDISLIPIMIILTSLSGETSSIIIPLILSFVKAALFIGIALFLSMGLIPLLLNFITSTSKELLLIASVGIATGTAIVGQYFGVSLALGAFVAGLALSVTIHSKQVVAEVIPFRDAFAMVFFVSIGMMMDIEFFLGNIALVVGVTVALVCVKFLISFIVVFWAGYPGQTALWAGLTLFQIGEFSFIIAKLGIANNIISDDIYSLTIISTLMTMLITPFVVRKIPDIVFKLQAKDFWNKYFKGKVVIKSGSTIMNNHVVIAGFGPIGRGVAKIMSLNNEPYIIIELNNKTIQDLHHQNIPAIYGDATNAEILSLANIENAKILIITLPDFKSCELATLNARNHNSELYIIVRARYQSHIDILYNAGASVVIYEEYETSLGLTVSALEKMNYSRTEIETIAKLIHSNQFEILRESCHEQTTCRTIISSLKQSEIDWIKVLPEHSFCNKTIAESNIRRNTGVSIISVAKKNMHITNPTPDIILESEDIISVMGQNEQIEKLKQLITYN